MRASKYAKEALQQYDMTVVDLQGDASTPAQYTPAPPNGAAPSNLAFSM